MPNFVQQTNKNYRIMYLAQTTAEVDVNNVALHVNNRPVIIINCKNEPNKFWFVYRNSYENFGRDAKIFRGKKVGQLIDNFY